MICKVRVGLRGGQERLPDTRDGIKALVHKDIQRRRGAWSMSDLRVFQRAREKKIVDGVASDGDAHALTINILDRPQRRVRRHEVGPLDAHHALNLVERVSSPEPSGAMRST